MSWGEPFKIQGEIVSWPFQSTERWHNCGDGKTFMTLYVPSVRDNQDFYVLLIVRNTIRARFEFLADDHKAAKDLAIKTVRRYLINLRNDCRLMLGDII